MNKQGNGYNPTKSFWIKSLRNLFVALILLTILDIAIFFTLDTGATRNNISLFSGLAKIGYIAYTAISLIRYSLLPNKNI